MMSEAGTKRKRSEEHPLGVGMFGAGGIRRGEFYGFKHLGQPSVCGVGR
jgi:hypothetical protein